MNLSGSPDNSDDITSVVRMVKDYKKFINNSSSTTTTNQNLSFDMFSPPKGKQVFSTTQIFSKMIISNSKSKIKGGNH